VSHVQEKTDFRRVDTNGRGVYWESKVSKGQEGKETV
jgi:hypothetical protein